MAGGSLSINFGDNNNNYYYYYRSRRDDVSVDRLSHQYSPTLFMLFSIVVSVKQYVGAPIECWCPAQFTQSHVDYTNAICWVNRSFVTLIFSSHHQHSQNKIVLSAM